MRGAVRLCGGFVARPAGPQLLAGTGASASAGAARGRAPSIWLHAVSLGEMSAAAPLIRALQARHPRRAVAADDGDAGGPSPRAGVVRRRARTYAFCPTTRRARCGDFWRGRGRGSPSSWRRSFGRICYRECERRGVPVLLAKRPPVAEVGRAISALRRFVQRRIQRQRAGRRAIRAPMPSDSRRSARRRADAGRRQREIRSGNWRRRSSDAGPRCARPYGSAQARLDCRQHSRGRGRAGARCACACCWPNPERAVDIGAAAQGSICRPSARSVGAPRRAFRAPQRAAIAP